MHFVRPILPFTLVFAVCTVGRAEEPAFEAAAGFVVEEFAGDDLATNIFSMTIDAKGRVVVAGPDYVKILHDDDRDGRADRASLYSNVPASGAHGMYFEGPNLVCTGDDGLWRFHDTDGDDSIDGPGQKFANLRHPEHGANGVVKGPDGWYYVVCGNDAGVSEEHAKVLSSPVARPRCGAVVRFDPEYATSQVVAHGFRNPYDLAFGPAGHLFTVDSDGERDHHLPWYAPTRLFDVAQGMEHGWLLQGWTKSWNRPEYFFDNVERLAEFGRGSPTGLIVYRHRQFPERYRGGVFSACWTMGRVYFCRLEPDAASFHATKEVFLQTTGETGFAPVDMAVGPEGDLFVAIGGRGTRGGVFRVRYGEGEVPRTSASREENSKLLEVLAADEPLSSWSRSRWIPLAKALGAETFSHAATDPRLDSSLRIRAIEVLVELFGIDGATAWTAIHNSGPQVRARVAWAIERNPTELDTRIILCDLAADSDPCVQRSTWAALGCLPEDLFPDDSDSLDGPELRGFWRWASVSGVRRVRQAAFLAAGRYPYLADNSADPAARLWSRVFYTRENPELPFDRAAFLNDALSVLAEADTVRERLDATRLLEIGLGDVRAESDAPEVYSGYIAGELDEIPVELRHKIAVAVTEYFLSDDPRFGAECSRLAGMLGEESPTTLGLSALILAGHPSQDPVERNLHGLIAFSRLPGPRDEQATRIIASALVRLHARMKADGLHPSRNWPLRVGELFDALVARDPALPAALVSDPRFGMAEHSLFVERMTGETQQAGARSLLAAAMASSESDAWTSELVHVLAVLPAAETLPALRERWDDFALRDAIALVIAQAAEPQDRGRLIEALSSPQSEVVEAAAGALARLDPAATPNEFAAALSALRPACAVQEYRNVRQALDKLLRHWTSQPQVPNPKSQIPPPIPDPDEPAQLAAAYQPWFDWFAEAHPEAARNIAGFSGDAAAWRERLAGVDWSVGEAESGKRLFELKACHRCHTGASRLGPDIVPAVRRLERDDLFAAIVDPSKEVAPTHQTTLVATKSGKVHHGLIVYESPDGTLLQTGPDTTIRIPGDDFATMQPSSQSLMPTGLLNDLSDRDLADLYAYLRGIR